MNVAASTETVEVGILTDRLSQYLEVVRNGGEVIIADQGQPVARLTAVFVAAAATTDLESTDLESTAERLEELVAAGIVSPPASAARYRPRRPIQASGGVSDLVADQPQ